MGFVELVIELMGIYGVRKMSGGTFEPEAAIQVSGVTFEFDPKYENAGQNGHLPKQNNENIGLADTDKPGTQHVPTEMIRIFPEYQQQDVDTKRNVLNKIREWVISEEMRLSEEVVRVETDLRVLSDL